jgi:hypothetical protein
MSMSYDKISVHVRALAALGVSSEQYGRMLIPIIMSKLPSDICLEIARKSKGDVWKIDDLLDTIKTYRLENESVDLKQENQLFRSKIDYQEQELLHLNNKLKTLEDERASLITVIRLLHSDRDENNKSYSQCKYQSVVRTWQHKN